FIDGEPPRCGTYAGRAEVDNCGSAHCCRWRPTGAADRWWSVKPSATPSMVRIHHLPPHETPAQGRLRAPESFPGQADASRGGRMPLVGGYTWDTSRRISA